MTYTRHDKMEWLEETCGEQFLFTVLDELVRWTSEKDFEEFYAYLCRNWEIKRDPNDPEYDDEIDNMED